MVDDLEMKWVDDWEAWTVEGLVDLKEHRWAL